MNEKRVWKDRNEEDFYTETYSLGFPNSRVKVEFDFSNKILFFRPVRMTTDKDHPINDLCEEDRVVMPELDRHRRIEVQRVLRLLQDILHIACAERGLAHDFDLYPEKREHYVRRTSFRRGTI